NNLVTIANSLEIDRLVMIGDRKQLQPIEAGKAFSLIQSHDPATARMDTSLRQTTPHMQQVATLTREGNFREAFEVLGERVQSEGKDYIAVAADKWLALGPEDRESTALYASGRATRSELNERVQQGLRDDGTLTGEVRSLVTLQPVHATREDLRYAHTYREGQVLEVVRNSEPGGLTRGRYEVSQRNEDGTVRLANERGKEFDFDPQKIDPQDRRDAIRLMEKQDVQLQQGDKIRWTANDKNRDLLNSEAAKVLEVNGDTVRIENANGDIVDLKAGDKMLEHLGLSYAINMHQAQGMTSTNGIGVMHSSERNLATQSLTHVMATRVREDISIVTNDADQLTRTIENHPGHKTSALESIGEKNVENTLSLDTQDNGKTAPAAPEKDFNPTIPEGVLNRDTLASLGGADKGSMGPGPMIDMPERNIERSR
ncbi:MAG: AAA family ATPase, partial [Alteraurantiacibacter sp.]